MNKGQGGAHGSLLIAVAVMGCMSALACHGGATVSRDRYLELASRPATPERAADLDKLLREYHRRAVLVPAAEEKIVGVITDPAGRPLSHVHVTASFRNARNPFLADGDKPLATKEWDLTDGRFEVSWKGYDKATIDFKNGYFMVQLEFRSRGFFLPPLGGIQREPVNEYDAERVAAMIQEGTILPVPESKDEIRVVVRKLNLDRDDTQKQRVVVATRPLKNVKRVEFNPADIKPGLVILKSGEFVYVPVPVDGFYCFYMADSRDQLMRTRMKKGDFLGFKPSFPGETLAEIPWIGSAYSFKNNLTGEWRLEYLRPDVSDPSTAPASRPAK